VGQRRLARALKPPTKRARVVEDSPALSPKARAPTFLTIEVITAGVVSINVEVGPARCGPIPGGVEGCNSRCHKSVMASSIGGSFLDDVARGSQAFMELIPSVNLHRS
ncbi:unnamed protein product, partial [Ilex paraguariensis]